MIWRHGRPDVSEGDRGWAATLSIYTGTHEPAGAYERALCRGSPQAPRVRPYVFSS